MSNATIKFKKYLEDNRYKRKDVANYLGCSQNYISLIIKHNRRPSYDFMVKIQNFTKNKVKLSDWGRCD